MQRFNGTDVAGTTVFEVEMEPKKNKEQVDTNYHPVSIPTCFDVNN